MAVNSGPLHCSPVGRHRPSPSKGRHETYIEARDTLEAMAGARTGEDYDGQIHGLLDHFRETRKRLLAESQAALSENSPEAGDLSGIGRILDSANEACREYHRLRSVLLDAYFARDAESEAREKFIEAHCGEVAKKKGPNVHAVSQAMIAALRTVPAATPEERRERRILIGYFETLPERLIKVMRILIPEIDYDKMQLFKSSERRPGR
jgi:hypothetical protein